MTTPPVREARLALLPLGIGQGPEHGRRHMLPQARNLPCPLGDSRSTAT
jgi:hypothetical protein